MKKLQRRPTLLLYISYYAIKLYNKILTPFQNMPTPDFNDDQDSLRR